MPGAGWAGCGLWRMGLRCREARRGQRQGASEKERSESGEGQKVSCGVSPRVACRMAYVEPVGVYYLRLCTTTRVRAGAGEIEEGHVACVMRAPTNARRRRKTPRHALAEPRLARQR